MLCSVDECYRLVKCKGLCVAHLNPYYKYGTPTPTRECKNCSVEYKFMGLHLGSSNRFCPNCFGIYSKYLKVNNLGYLRDRNTEHGINAFEYHKRLLDQNGGCKLCNAKENLEIDHDRDCCNGDKSCGKCIRGILCHNCNCMIGHYEKCKGDLTIETFDGYLEESKVNAIA